jgi:hypothetical protein
MKRLILAAALLSFGSLGMAPAMAAQATTSTTTPTHKMAACPSGQVHNKQGTCVASTKSKSMMKSGAAQPNGSTTATMPKKSS